MDQRELDILSSTISNYPECRMLQIGTASGVTAFTVLPRIKEVNGKFVTVDIDISPGGGTHPKPAERNDQFQAKLNKSDFVDIVEYHRNGADAYFEQNKEEFDIIFVDGDHRYAQSKRDLENSMKILAEGGVIYLHDVVDRTQGKGRKHTVARVFDEFNQDGWVKKHLGTRYGLAQISRT